MTTTKVFGQVCARPARLFIYIWLPLFWRTVLTSKSIDIQIVCASKITQYLNFFQTCHHTLTENQTVVSLSTPYGIVSPSHGHQSQVDSTLRKRQAMNVKMANMRERNNHLVWISLDCNTVDCTRVLSHKKKTTGSLLSVWKSYGGTFERLWILVHGAYHFNFTMGTGIHICADDL